ncbi:MAG: hypothetical protein ACLGHL_01245 [Actinomycetota bacterium]
MTPEASQTDFLDKARRAAVAGMLAAALAMVLGSFLDWISIVRLPKVLPESELQRAGAVTGTEAGDGWWVVILAAVLINAALLLWMKRKSFWGWVGFITSIVVGSIGIADYRAIARSGSPFLQQLDVVGEIDHGIGILLVLAGGLLGVIFSLVGVAASPYTSQD